MLKYCSILFLLVACKIPSEQQNLNPAISQNTVSHSPNIKNYTYLSLGDSYTIGQSVSEKDRWSIQLADLLKTQNFVTNKVNIFAQTGWTAQQLSESFQKSAFNNNSYDMVSLLIGVNNQYHGQSVEAFRIEFITLLNTATRLAQAKANHVFVLSIPDWGVTPVGGNKNGGSTSSEIDTFNKVIKDECDKAGITMVDITEISRTALNDSNMIASDQFHFSGKMYGLWAAQALETAKEILK